jgi:GTP-binding protein
VQASETKLDSNEALERGRWLFVQECRFISGAASLAQVPETVLPEVAFAGRSNVGKSSLINALTGRKTLARTSNTPGRTRQINFFDLGGRLMLADLPGYGFARAPKEQISGWTELIDAYLKGRAELRRCCLLIDARHGAKDSDRKVMAMLDGAAVSYQVVIVKSDKITETELAARGQALIGELAGHPAAHPKVIPVSSRLGSGIAELRAALAALAANR